MSRKIERFELLLKLAERKRKDAERLLAEAQQRVRQAESGLAQLGQYQLEYQQQFTAAGRNGLAADQLQTYQRFISKIGNATAQQQEALAQSRAQLEAVETHWRSTLARQKTMQKLLEKAQDEQRRLDDKRLQQQLDERAQHRRSPFA